MHHKIIGSGVTWRPATPEAMTYCDCLSLPRTLVYIVA
jgi:hypothetical protein